MRAIIYTRVSSDTAGHGRSVSEQESECRAICEREGWVVGEVLTDNDIGASRHSRKDRPAYRRLNEILRPGDVLVTWEASRAQRDLAAYVQLRDLCTTMGVRWSYGGTTYDLSTGEGRFTTGLHALMSENEAEKTRERVLRAFRANAADGKPHGKIPYGYRAVRDPQTGVVLERAIDPEPAAIIRECTRRILAGESPWSVAKDLNERGVATPRGAAEWTGRRVNLMLIKPTNAGLRSHHGAITPGNWDAIISHDDHRKLVRLLTNPNRRVQRGVAAKHLLSGIALCGVCGATVERLKNGGYPTYTCTKGRCVGRNLEKTDFRVVEEVLSRFEDPRLAGTIKGATDSRTLDAYDEIEALEARLKAAAKAASNGTISFDALGIAERQIKDLIKQQESKISVGLSPLLMDVVGPDARDTWKSYTIEQRRSVIRPPTIVVTIKPTNKRGRVFDPESVEVEWNKELTLD